MLAPKLKDVNQRDSTINTGNTQNYLEFTSRL